jgi:hypothetical protein
MTGPRNLRCGIVGAGRTRHGTGPFLASFLEGADCDVVGVVGRSFSRGRSAAEDLAQRLGHAVEAHACVEDLLASGLDALVIAAPDEVHLPALRASLEARTPVLCEKPLVQAEEHEAVAALVDGFRSRDILLMEGCQWPMVMAAFDGLYPERSPQPTRFAMRLSPIGPGPSMLRNSLSHLISLIQVEWPVGPDTTVESLAFEGSGGVEDGLVTSFDLRNRPSGVGDESTDRGSAACRLELVVCPDQPRPAWVEIDGHRMGREVDLVTYAISFVAGERKISVDDPTKTLVYRFADLVKSPSRERYRTESNRVEQRARLYSHIVRGLVEHLASS